MATISLRIFKSAIGQNPKQTKPGKQLMGKTRRLEIITMSILSASAVRKMKILDIN